MTTYKDRQKEAKAALKQPRAIWPASKGQAFRLDKIGQPNGKAEIKAMKKARTRHLRETQK